MKYQVVRINIVGVICRYKLLLTQLRFGSACLSVSPSLERIPGVNPCLHCLRSSRTNPGLENRSMIGSLHDICVVAPLGTSIVTLNGTADDK